ncbi:MAG: hypothetical protein HOP07_06805 [Bacteriovoracaceae bacterium]|nr:hypothetical protein [Bacteriovoracaceae bacterium]
MSSGMNPINLFALLFFSGGICVIHALKKIKHKTKIKNISKQLISSASAGLVEIEGVTWPLRSITHDLSGREIVCRSMVIKKRVNRGKRTKYETVWSKQSVEPFLIFDQTGFFLVEPAYSPLHSSIISELVTEHRYVLQGINKKGIESFYDFYDNSLSGLRLTSEKNFLTYFFPPLYLIFERTIEIGSPLLVHAHLFPDDSKRFVNLDLNLQSFREKVSRVLKSTNFKQTIFDKDKDGVIDEYELSRGFKGAMKASLKTPILNIDIKNNGTISEKIYGSLRSSASHELIIHNTFEEQLLNSKPIFKNWAELIIGAILIGCSIIVLLKSVIQI